MDDARTPISSQPASYHGTFRVKIDEKGRVSLPAIFRRAIPTGEDGEGGTLVLMKGPDGYLQALSVQEWEARIERLQSVSEWKGEEGRWRRRRIFGAVTPTSLDEKGRFTIPKDLLETVGIGRQCLILGVERSIEIWDPDRYFELEKQRQTELSGAEEDILF